MFRTLCFLFCLLVTQGALAAEADLYWLGGISSTGAPIWIPVSIANPMPTTGSGAITGTPPIVVTGNIVSCPTCGTSAANVESVNGSTANGFFLSFTNPTTTPVGAIATSGVSGMVKDVSNGLVSAVAGTDYAAPATTLAGYGITNGATSGANSNITSLSGLTTPLSVAQGGTGATSLTGLITSADLANTAVTAGSYTSANITVNAQGQITAAANGSGGGGSLTITDGSHTVANTTQITVTGGTVGGTTPNATLTISAAATSFTPGTTTISGGGSPCALVNTTGTTSACLAYGQSGASTLIETGGGGFLAAGIIPFGTATNQVAEGGVITAGGPTGSATVAPIVTYNAAGQLTAVSTATITPAIGSVTGLGTGIATALGVAIGSAGAPVTNGGALGTPSSGVGTNLTGTASGLTAGNVTTNANMTGDVTSSGSNATTVAKIAGVSVGTPSGTGNVAFTNSPTFVTPTLGAASATSVALSTGTVTNVPTPVASTDAANKAYVDNVAAGLNPAVATAAATTTVLPNSPTYSNGASGVGATLTAGSAAALVIDGYTPILNDRLLIKNQASAFQNGIYFLSTIGTGLIPYVLTRALDYDQPSDMNSTGAIPVVNGTANTTTSWLLTSQVATVGTSALTFTQYSLNPSTIVTTTSQITAAIPIVWDSNTTVVAATIPIMLPPWATAGGTITGVSYYTNGTGTPSFTADVTIGGTGVTGCSAISVSSATQTTTPCSGGNTFTSSSSVALVVSSVSGTPNQAIVQINFTHTPN